MGRSYSQAYELNEQKNFNKNELERYSRQILLFGRAGQEKLKLARVVVIGAGGLGCNFLPVIAACGVGQIWIWDSDRIEQSNLGRQLLYHEKDLGRNKAEVAAERLKTLNPYIAVEAVPRDFSADDERLLFSASLIFEGSDSLKSKFLLNDLALRYRVPLIISALGNAQGHTMLISNDSPCYRCVFDEIDESMLPTCANEGILSSFPAFVATQAAHLAVGKILEPQLVGGFWLFEKNHCRAVRIQKRKDCHHP